MEYLKRINVMAVEPQPNHIWDFLTTLLPWATCYGTMHTVVYYVFKYWTESRDAKIEEAVDKRFKLQVKPLEDKIDKLTNLVIQHIDSAR